MPFISHCSYLKSLVPSFNECVDRLVAGLKPLADGRTSVPMTDQFSSVALDVISRVSNIMMGGKGGNLPPLTAVFPPFRLAVIIVYYIFQKTIHP